MNVEELAARIAGSNLAFREMEAALDEKGVWHAARLRPLVERAEILVLRRGDLQLLRNLVPEPDRKSLVRLESPKAAIAELAPDRRGPQPHGAAPTSRARKEARRRN